MAATVGVAALSSASKSLAKPKSASVAIGVRREQRRQDFNRDIASELCVARAVDIAHAAGADQLHDVVRTETVPAVQRTASHVIDGGPLGEAPCLLMRDEQ